MLLIPDFEKKLRIKKGFAIQFKYALKINIYSNERNKNLPKIVSFF